MTSAGFRLVRVDDRLLHGQVVFGWGQALAPRGYLIVDDEIAADPWEREAMMAIAPGGAEVDVREVGAFLDERSGWPSAAEETILLLRDLPTARRLTRAGFSPARGFNLGGLHAHRGTRELLPYVHLTQEDRTILRELFDAGVSFYAQDLPTSPRVSGARLQEMLAAST